ncbi:MAG: nucleotidyltransferase family protein [Candidatus Xenobia bacterium]
MVLAAGLGSRLGDITQVRPKCLVEVDGCTILEHVVEHLKLAGVTELVINLYYLGDQIEAFVRDHHGFGLQVHFSWEDTLLGTGGGLLHAAPCFEGEELFLVHNSDVFSDLDLRQLVAFHKQHHAVASLAVMDRSTQRYLLFDNHHLAGWRNLGTGESRSLREGELTPLAFSGIQCLSPAIFRHMRDEGAFSLTRPYLRAAEAGENVLGFRMDGAYWVDMGTPERLEALRQKLAS